MMDTVDSMFQDIAALPPDQRQEQIDQVRNMATNLLLSELAERIVDNKSADPYARELALLMNMRVQDEDYRKLMERDDSVSKTLASLHERTGNTNLSGLETMRNDSSKISPRELIDSKLDLAKYRGSSSPTQGEE